MKNLTKRLSVGLLGLVFLLALTSVSPVEARVPMRWDVTVAYLGGIYWDGDIWREDRSHGDFSMVLTDYTLLSNGQKIAIVWLIEWDDGGYLQGTFKGTYVYTTHEYGLDGGDVVGNGKVTDTSPELSELDGRPVHVMASICPWPWIAEGVFQIN